MFETFETSLKEINYDSPRGGVSVITEKGDVTTSYLLIQRAKSSDSGQYTCSPSNANPKTVQIHILKGSSQGFFYFLNVWPVCESLKNQGKKPWLKALGNKQFCGIVLTFVSFTHVRNLLSNFFLAIINCYLLHNRIKFLQQMFYHHGSQALP